MSFPFAVQETTPMVINIAHDVNTKEGHVSIAAKLNSNFDGKLTLPSKGDPVATLVGSHRCEEPCEHAYRGYETFERWR